jgi:tRNA(adenine34) deaminase
MEEIQRSHLEAAMEEACHAYEKGTYPVGALIVSPNGQIISRGHNQVYSEGDYTAHAEVEAIRKAGHQLMQKGNFKRCTLYTTLEPCLMCLGAILLARIKYVVWVMDDDVHGRLRTLHEHKHLNSLYVDLEISQAKEHDLIERMETWMKDWNEAKETVLSNWSEKDRSMLPSLG